MVDAALLERVRPGTILINTARGDLLDNLAVRQALIEGRLGGAGFDVLSPEPPSAALTPGCGTRSAPCWRAAVPATWSTDCDPRHLNMDK